jgi:hypothetical protein
MQAATANPHASSSQKRVNVAPYQGYFLLEFVGSLDYFTLHQFCFS